MSYEILAEGFISRREPSTPTAVAAGPRCAVCTDGTLVCTFLAQSALGMNDFKPMLSRSSDQGATWSEARLIWPELQTRFSIFGSVSRSPSGDLYFYGMRTPIDRPGEAAWSDATQGLKQNELVWSHSADHGKTWAPFKVIPMPIPGSAEAPGPLCVTRGGDFVCCYAPYNTFDPKVQVPKNQVICLTSRDRGASWTHSAMHRFPQANANGAESWVVELSDGALLGTTWHVAGEIDQPNAYAISHDAGKSWSATRSTGIMGQSTGLAALPNGRALFIYNQRKQRDPGVWLAVVKPSDTDFGVISNERIWAAEITSQIRGSDDLKDWTNFAFGEPSATVLPDGTVLVALWALQPSGHGIRFVKLKI